MNSHTWTAITTWKFHSKKTKKLGPNVFYHRFSKLPDNFLIWESKCKSDDVVNEKNATDCNEHFQLTDYDNEMKTRSLACPRKDLEVKTKKFPSVILLVSTQQNLVQIIIGTKNYKNLQICSKYE